MITKSTFIIGLIAAFALGFAISGSGARSCNSQDQYLVNEGVIYRFPAAVQGGVQILDKKNGQWVVITPEK